MMLADGSRLLNHHACRGRQSKITLSNGNSRHVQLAFKVTVDVTELPAGAALRRLQAKTARGTSILLLSMLPAKSKMLPVPALP